MLRISRALCIGSLLIAATSAPAAAGDAEEFATFMIEAIEPKPGLGSMAPVPEKAMQDLRNFAKLVFEVPHPPKFEDLEATVRAVMDPKINSRSGRAPDWQNSQQRLVDEILKLVGHGARRADDSKRFSDPPPKPTKKAPSAEARRSVWYVGLPDLGALGNDVASCRDLKGLLDIPPAAAVRGVALDLRGTRHGDFFEITCVANAFVTPGTTMFLVTRKPDEVLTFKSGSKIGRTPIDLPLVIMIDRNTDRVPLMLAVTLRNLGRAKLIGERPADFDGTYFEEFRFGAFGEYLDRDKNDHDGVWIPMRIAIPVGEFQLPSGYPPDVVLHVDVPVETSDERALFKAVERMIDETEFELELQKMKTGAVLSNGARFTMQ